MTKTRELYQWKLEVSLAKVLELKKARQADPARAASTQLDREIQSVEQYLAGQGKNR